MPRTDPGRDILNALITDLTAIRRMPPKDRIQALVPLLDRASPDRAETRLATARSHAARDAAADAGGQTALAAELGVTPQRISSLISGMSSRKRKSQTGAAGG